MLWSLIITGASILLNSVMEEKSNKILEVLLSSASATEILTGKVLGVAMLTLTVLIVLGRDRRVRADHRRHRSRRRRGVGADGPAGCCPDFLAYMVGGYLMYAVLFAAIGAFCETPRDAQTLMGPIMMVLVVPILVMQMALVNPDAPVVRILSLGAVLHALPDERARAVRSADDRDRRHHGRDVRVRPADGLAGRAGVPGGSAVGREAELEEFRRRDGRRRAVADALGTTKRPPRFPGAAFEILVFAGR